MVRAVGLSWTMVLSSMQWPQSLSRLNPWTSVHWANLVHSIMGINGFGGLFSWPLGYVIVRVQVEEVRGYDKDQVALVVPDSTAFRSWVPVTVGTLTINWIINMIKESEIDELSASFNWLRVSDLLACHQAELSVRSEMAVNQIMCTTDLNKAVKMISKEEIEAFLSETIPS